jgi:hypothetical protein
MSGLQLVGRVGVVLACAAGLVLPGCKKDEPPPPLPMVASAAPVATPEKPLQLVPEDAGLPPKPEETAKAAAPKAPAASLKKCCDALKQNAASAPEPTRTYMLQSAATCDALVAAGQDKTSIVAMVNKGLKGAGVPVACK